MVRKKIDNRIRIAIENNVALGHRSLFVIVGEKAKDQVRIVALRFSVEDYSEYSSVVRTSPPPLIFHEELFRDMALKRTNEQ